MNYIFDVVISESKIHSITAFLDKHKNVIIFSSVVLLSLQMLIYFTIYRLNFPYSVDFWALGEAYVYASTGIFPFEEFFFSREAHILIFPKLIMISNALLNSFDVVNIYYLQWAILSISLFFMYSLLKRTDQRLTWLLIPIAAFSFNLIFNSSYWAFGALVWVIPSFGAILAIYLLDKKKFNWKFFGAAISVAVFTTFSTVIGIVVWLVGIVSLMRINSSQKRWTGKKWLAIWILSMIVSGLIYYALTDKSQIPINLDLFFSLDGGLAFITRFLATPFRLKYDFLMVAVGSATLILSAFCAYYFVVWKKKAKEVLPWLIFLLIGIASATIAALGRVDGSLYHNGNIPSYILMAHLTQFGILVLISLIILDLNRLPSSKRKKVLLGFCFTIIITQMVLSVPSYYIGWTRGEYYYQEKSAVVECYSLSHDADCAKIDGLLNRNVDAIYAEGMNYLLENKLSIFGEDTFNQQNAEDLLKFEQIWYNNEMKKNIGFGKIETINDIKISDTLQPIDLEKWVVTISGWTLDQQKRQLDSIYLLVNDKPLLKYDDFKPRLDVKDNLGQNAELNSGWTISFLSGYIQEGCHKITVVGLKGENKIILDEEIQACKNYP